MLSDLNIKSQYISETLVSIYKQFGLENSLAFLFATFKEVAPISHVYFSLRNKKDLSFIPLADVGDRNYFELSNTQIFFKKNTTPDDWQLIEDLNDSTIINDFAKFTALHSKSLDLSQLRVKVWDLAEHILFFGIWSYETNIFDDEDILFCKDILQKLLEEMRPNFFSEATIPKHSWLQNPLDSIRLLRLNNGASNVQQKIEKIALLDTTVLLTGETGTGKGVTARAIHELSNRRNKNFVAVNCGAIPESIIESQLFGHEKGSFTNAYSTHAGYFEQAHGGTIFLDEVAELSLMAQVKLLHVLDNFEIYRVGADKPLRVNVRIIAATNKNLLDLINRGLFREDLLYRLFVYNIELPPLRMRRPDIKTLAQYFIVKKSEQIGITIPQVLPQEELNKLFAYDWPGNIRELEYTIERSLIESRINSDFHKLTIDIKSFKTSIIQDNTENNFPTLEEYENAYIKKVLQKTNGRVFGIGGAAEILAMHPNTLRNKMERLGLRIQKVGTVTQKKNVKKC